MILMIDNYDSFTFNLVQYFQELHQQIKVVRNDEISCEEITQLAPERIVISPGPCTPDDAGISLQAVKKFKGKIPILGVCLGHQVIAQALGGKIIRADEVIHGKISSVHHLDKNLLRGLPNPFNATRYHSLVVDKNSLPEQLTIDAWTEDEKGNKQYIMSLQDTENKLYGIQFHPEAILTEHGHKLLENFLKTS